MSLDKSLKSKSALARHRNVLTRAERIEKLKEQDVWTEGTDPFALPKIVHRKSTAGAKDKSAAKKTEEAEAGEADKTEKTES